MRIENISPSEVIPGEEFSIEFDLINDEPVSKRVKIYIEENANIIPDSQITSFMRPNETFHFSYRHPGIYRTSFFTIVVETASSRPLIIPFVFPAMLIGMISISRWGKWVK